jgi:hypothetical protein
VASLVDARLYLPEEWANDPERCEGVGVPENLRELRTKGEIALEMVLRLRREGLHFSFVGFDGGYGHLPWLLRELDGEGETFVSFRQDCMKSLDVLGKVGCEFNLKRSGRWTTWRRWRQ